MLSHDVLLDFVPCGLVSKRWQQLCLRLVWSSGKLVIVALLTLDLTEPWHGGLGKTVSWV